MAFWACSADVIASRSFCSVWSRVFPAVLSACFAEVHELAPAVLVAVLADEVAVAAVDVTTRPSWSG